MSDTTTALVGGGFTLLGASIGFVGQWLQNRRASRAIRSAAVAELIKAVAELQAMVASNRQRWATRPARCRVAFRGLAMAAHLRHDLPALLGSATGEAISWAQQGEADIQLRVLPAMARISGAAVDLWVMDPQHLGSTALAVMEAAYESASAVYGGARTAAKAQKRLDRAMREFCDMAKLANR